MVLVIRDLPNFAPPFGAIASLRSASLRQGALEGHNLGHGY